MASKLGVVVVVIAFDRCLFDRAVHPFDLSIRPGMLDLGQAVLDAMLAADAIEDMLEGMDIGLAVGELDAVISQYRMEPVGEWSR